jgi:hypothetical protein
LAVVVDSQHLAELEHRAVQVVVQPLQIQVMQELQVKDLRVAMAHLLQPMLAVLVVVVAQVQ